MLNGCADCVRGSTAPVDELAYILSHAHCSGLVLQVGRVRGWGAGVGGAGGDGPPLSSVVRRILMPRGSSV